MTATLSREAHVDDRRGAAADLQHLYEQAVRRRSKGGAAGSTVEALMYSLRERRLPALKEPETKRRLAQLSEEQLVEVAGRLQRLKPHIAQAWSDQEIAELFIARTNVKPRRN